MTSRPGTTSVMELASRFLGSPAATRAIATSAIGSAFLSHLIRSLIGWPGLVGIVVVLTALAAGSLFIQRGSLEWRGVLTVSLIAFVSWCALSVFWSDYQWATLAGSLYQIAVAVLGVHIALLRDLIQVVRAFGDVLRAVLGASLVLEVMSGLLIDEPIRFLGITGGLGNGEAIQGLMGSRNLLGLVALLALATFAVEWATRSVTRGVAIGSVVAATLVLLLTQSPVALGTLALVGLSAFALWGLRRLTVERRRIGQFVLLGTMVIGLAFAWIARTPIIDALNAGSEFEYRYAIWKQILGIAGTSLEGFGWLGAWNTDIPPFVYLAQGGAQPSALNAYLDVWLQVGLVGLLFFIALLGLALVRSWLLASQKKSITYAWPALVLVILLVTSAAESSVLLEFGWLILVICAIRGSEGLSWRSGLIDRESPA